MGLINFKMNEFLLSQSEGIKRVTSHKAFSKLISVISTQGRYVSRKIEQQRADTVGFEFAT